MTVIPLGISTKTPLVCGTKRIGRDTNSFFVWALLGDTKVDLDKSV